MKVMETVDYLGQKIRKWNIGASTFLARPEKGALLMSWFLKMADGSMRDILYWPTLDSPEDLSKVRGGNPILFPFCARTFDKGDIGFWTDPLGKRRPMPMHGFARNGSYSVIEIDDGGFTALLQPTQEDSEAYPFRYEFFVVYRFRELSLVVELRLTNQDTCPIPWSAGHHFYFLLPWHDGATRGDYRIILPARKSFYHAADGRLEQVKDFSIEEDFSNPRLVDRHHFHFRDNRVRFGPKSGDEDITLHLGADHVPHKNMTVVTWTESDDSPFYCVEPWMGPPNSPEHKKGLNFVNPGDTGIFSVEISLG